MLTIKEDVPLKDYSTMRLGGNARFFCVARDEGELLEAVSYAKDKSIRIKMIGGGSNIIWPDSGFNGLVVVNRIKIFEVTGTKVVIGAGLDWDETVQKIIDEGLSGVEFLSFIPGRAGATPVQNVGAYGKEISEVLLNVRAYDLKNGEFVTLSNAECDFGYRKSRFNTTDLDRFLITTITLELSNEHAKPPFYESLQKYLDDNGTADYSPQNIRDAVIEVRKAKLPDPDYVANNGSFFANPVVKSAKFAELVKVYPEIPNWKQGEDIKISAAWLIEYAGFKDYHDQETGMATWNKQALVLINEHATSTADLEKFKQKIVTAIQEKFGITLEQEPELVR